MEREIVCTGCALVKRVADRMHATPVVKGPRMPTAGCLRPAPTDGVVENYAAGSPVSAIAENSGLKEADICAILKYAAAHSHVS